MLQYFSKFALIKLEQNNLVIEMHNHFDCLSIFSNEKAKSYCIYLLLNRCSVPAEANKNLDHQRINIDYIPTKKDYVKYTKVYDVLNMTINSITQKRRVFLFQLCKKEKISIKLFCQIPIRSAVLTETCTKNISAFQHALCNFPSKSSRIWQSAAHSYWEISHVVVFYSETQTGGTQLSYHFLPPIITFKDSCPVMIQDAPVISFQQLI